MRAAISRILLVAAVLSLPASTSFAAAFNPRPVFLNGAALQAFFNGAGQAINVNTDQHPAALWTTSASGNSTFSIRLELAGNAASNRVGIYNEGAPGTLFEVFSGAAAPGWFAVASFNVGMPGHLVVNLFNNSASLMSTTSYMGVNSTHFGFYLSGPGGTFYSEDDENGGNAHSLVYAATGSSVGSWWMAWEDLPGMGDQDYNDFVMFAESVNPVPEPGSLLLLGLSLGMGTLIYRKKRR